MRKLLSMGLIFFVQSFFISYGQANWDLFGEWDVDAYIRTHTVIDVNTPEGLNEVAELLNESRIHITYQSYNVPTDILGKDALEFTEKGSYKNYPQQMWASLYPLHDDTKKPTPAVVLSPGSLSLYRTPATKQKFINFFHKLGMTVLILDHFGPRGIDETAMDQIGQISLESGVIDAFHALKVLKKLSFIDPHKIYMGGLSRGGLQADLTSRKFYQQAISPEDRFAAHFAFYPLILSQEKKPELTGAPICYLVGEKDDICPASITEDYANCLNMQGAQVTVYKYPKAHHGFNVTELDTPGIALLNALYDGYCMSRPLPLFQKSIGWVADKVGNLKQFKGLQRLQNFTKCCYQYDDNSFQALTTPSNQKDWPDFKSFIMQNITYGGHLQYNEAAAEQSFKDLAQFLKTQMNRKK